MKLNWTKAALLAGLVALPLSALLLHGRIHPTISYLVYFTLFDIVVVTPLLAMEKYKAWGFYLNTLLVIIGALFHLTYNSAGTISDNLFLVSDFALGLALFKTKWK